MASTFKEFKRNRDQLSEGAGSGTKTELKLGKDNDFKPFLVDKAHHPNLRVLIQAFATSPEIAIDNEIDADTGGTKDITMKKKALYLVGGAVRDHLSGKTPKDFDLVTDATPPQIRRVLKHAGFTELKNVKGKRHPKGKDSHLPETPALGKNKKTFYAGGWDRSGDDMNFIVTVNGEEFELATTRSNHKGENGDTADKAAWSGLDGDSDKRDFTINAMYLPLDTPDGPNVKLIDMHGGIHHLKSGSVTSVGDFKDRLDEDPLRALRYIRFVSRFSKTGEVSDEYKAAIDNIKDLTDVPPQRIKAEFVHGLEHPDVDPRKYIKTYQALGVLGRVFPNMKFELNVPEDFNDKKDRILAVAWILRHNDPNKVATTLHDAKWDNREVNDITYLISLLHWGQKGKFNSTFYSDMKSKMVRTSLVPSKIRAWGQMAGLDTNQINHFLHNELPMKDNAIQATGPTGPTGPADNNADADDLDAQGTGVTGHEDDGNDNAVGNFATLAKKISDEMGDGDEDGDEDEGGDDLAPLPGAELDEVRTCNKNTLQKLWNKILTNEQMESHKENF